MKFNFIASILLIIAILINPIKAQDTTKSIQGNWIPVAAELGGKMFPDEVRKTITLAIKDDTYTVTVGQAVDEGTIKLNTSVFPKELNILGTAGPNKGRSIPAIFELDNDTLRICYDLSGKSKPSEFKTAEGTQLFLVTYARQK